MTFDVFDTGTPAMDGKAIRKQVTIYFSKNKNGPKEDLVVYVPAAAAKPVPLLLSIDFSPNASTFDDPGIKLGEIWNRDHKRVPAERGGGMFHMKIDNLLSSGYGVAAIYYGDIEPDFLGGLPFGVRALYLKPGQTEPAPDEWGAIAAWGWGMSRAMDYLETDKGVDAKRVGIYGVSRLGKTVMWAGARDTRFALVIASCSGEGGAALSRRNYGETIAHLTAPNRFPYQFCANYARYAAHVDQLPVDANLLVALMAPRPVLLQTGESQTNGPIRKASFWPRWRRGRCFGCLGKQGLGTDQMAAGGAADSPHHRLLHACRRTWNHPVRLGRVPEVHGDAVVTPALLPPAASGPFRTTHRRQDRRALAYLSMRIIILSRASRSMG